MKNIQTWFKRWQGTLKLILFMSIASLVVVELIRLFKTVSMAQIATILGDLSWQRIGLLIVLGFVAVSPMMLYDVILTRELKRPQKLGYLLETSWTINSLNNLVGFAGLVDVGLRYTFYADEERTDEGVKAISRVIPYFMSGLSLFSFLSLLGLYAFNGADSLRQYWWILWAAALYLPVVAFISSRQKLPYFGQLAPKTIGQLVGASFLDWLGVLSYFVLVGRFLGFSLPIYDIVPLFLIAIVIGIMSMIPGSIGSFDLVMVTGLVGLGLGKADALSWLLIFRLFYYILPFILGIFFFLKTMGSRINDKFLGLPKKVVTNLSQGMLTWGFRLFGFFLILSALIPQELSHIPILKHLSAEQGQIIWQAPSVILGMLYFLMARLIRRQLSSSVFLSFVLGFITLLYLNLGSLSLPSSAFILILTGLVWFNQGVLTRQRFIYSWEDHIKDFAYMGATFAVVLICLGHLNPHHVKLSSHLSHFMTHWFYFLVIALVMVVCYRFLVSISNRSQTSFGQAFDKERYDTFLDTINIDNLDAALAYLGDKLLYWYQKDGEDKAVFQFAMENNKCIVMSDPLVQEGYLEEAISDFLDAAEKANLSVVFYEINQTTTLLLHEYGYEFMKFGETAQVDLTQFTTQGKHGKKFRTIVNKLDNKGYCFEVVQPPFSDSLLDDLEAISDNWLDGRQEKGFSLGYFDRDYIQLAPIALVKDEQGKVEAFVTFLVSNGPKAASIDLMRYNLETAPNGVMDYLFVQLLLYFKEREVAYFDLGMAPLANVGTEKHSFLQEKAAYLIYAFTNRFYSFSGLRQYKQKYNPVWSPRYVVYPRDTWLLLDMIAIYRVDNRVVKK